MELEIYSRDKREDDVSYWSRWSLKKIKTFTDRIILKKYLLSWVNFKKILAILSADENVELKFSHGAVGMLKGTTTSEKQFGSFVKS